MFERYTERARRVPFFARYEAQQLGSATIETEHLLLRLIREGKGQAHRVLASVEGWPERVLSEIKARTASQETVNHLLLGTLREEESLAASILAEQGMRLTAVRADVQMKSIR